MSMRAPRHRAPQSVQARRTELQGMLALIAFPFLAAFLIWFAVRTDNVLLAIGLAVGSVIGTWWHDKRKSRAKQRRDEAGSARPARAYRAATSQARQAARGQ